jgi:uncharacterized membrane protein
MIRVATAMDGENSLNEAMICQIDQKIQKFEKQQQKYSAMVESAKAELEKFQATKQRCLEGAQLGGEESASFSETTARSLVKSMMWRVIAGGVTFLTSLRFSGSISTALSIVGSDFFSKAATMFVGERIMNKSQAGRKKGADAIGRSLAKALLWRVFAICNTLTMSFLIAENLSMASKIAGSDAIFKTGLMFVYERVWAKIEWGKEYLVEFSIDVGNGATQHYTTRQGGGDSNHTFDRRYILRVPSDRRAHRTGWTTRVVLGSTRRNASPECLLPPPLLFDRCV